MSDVVIVSLVGAAVIELAPETALSVMLDAPVGFEIVAVGYPGPRGTDGAAAGAYIHTQSAPSATWTMNHNLGYRPSCTLLTTGGVEFEGTVTHTSVNQAVASFEAAVSGTARFI